MAAGNFREAGESAAGAQQGGSMTDLPEKMTAVLQTGAGFSGTAEGPFITDAADYLELAEIPVPAPGRNQVLVRLRTASVNPSDIHFIKGEYGQPRVKGRPAGFEGCGDVVSAGEDAEGLVGKRVAFVATPGGSGSWADYAVTDASACIPLPPGISDDDGAAQIVNPLTAMAMVDIAKTAGDCFVLSAGTSQLGKLMIGLARDLGLKTIAFVRRADAIESTLDLGATAVLHTGDPELAAKFAALSADHKPRVFLDSVADPLSARIFSAMPNRSRWIIYGMLGTEPPVLNMAGQLIFMDKAIEGFWLTRWMMSAGPEDQARVVGEVQKRFSDGRWKTDVAKRLALRDVVSDLADALQIPGGKVMITP